MKILTVIVVGVLVGIFMYAYPLFQATLACYDKTTESFDDIGFRRNSRGLTDEEVCVARSGIIGQLDTCLIKANPTKTGNLLSPYILSVVSAVRPSFMDVKILKIEHNSNCQTYPDTLF